MLKIQPLTYINFEDCVIIDSIDFISPNASLAAPAKDNDQEEFSPHKLNEKNLLERTKSEHSSPRNIVTRTPHEEVLFSEPELLRGVWKLARIKEIKKRIKKLEISQWNYHTEDSLTDQ
ncbi:hypothetical protein WUBG_10094 [Wuchereria bancrofti]|uniref:DUF5641 domain-containing protein n=1 Tax=Wuchereria bancrofti TaxID=6293 RepID=J9EPL3_WUCBA|nr:hypothetical protein WUBG_10094 [Wuchereria bancrofti]